MYIKSQSTASTLHRFDQCYKRKQSESFLSQPEHTIWVSRHRTLITQYLHLSVLHFSFWTLWQVPTISYVCYVQVLLYITKPSKKRVLSFKVKLPGLLFSSSFPMSNYFRLYQKKAKLLHLDAIEVTDFAQLPIFKLWFNKVTSNSQNINSI